MACCVVCGVWHVCLRGHHSLNINEARPSSSLLFQLFRTKDRQHKHAVAQKQGIHDRVLSTKGVKSGCVV